MRPICGLSTPFPSYSSEGANAGAGVDWPLTDKEDGDASSLAIYGQISEKTGQPECVMYLSQMQVVYILGRSLEWRSRAGGGARIWDDIDHGFLVEPGTTRILEWYVPPPLIILSCEKGVLADVKRSE